MADNASLDVSGEGDSPSASWPINRNAAFI
jgi:hypothetical protein